MYQRINNKIIKYEKLLALMILSVAALVVLVRSFYTFCWTDESLYLATVHRIWNGESMFVDEWYTSQLTVPILLPFYALYCGIVGSNTGVFLFFRLLYFALALSISAYGYFVLKRRYKPVSSALAMAIYLTYSRCNIGGMSYYNMTLSFVLLGVLIIYGIDGSSIKKIDYLKMLFVGFLFALAVVCNPYLVVAYAFIFLYVCLRPSLKVWRKSAISCLVGSALTGICYMSFLLSRCSISQIIDNIPHVLNEPDLQSTSPILAIPIMFARVGWKFKYTIWITVGILIYLVWTNKKKKQVDKKIYLGLLIVNTLICFASCYIARAPLGCVNMALILYIIPRFFMEEKVGDKEDVRLLKLLLIAGIVMSLAFTFSSDTGLDAMSIGFVPVAAGLILVLTNRDYSSEKIGYICDVTAIGVVLIFDLVLRFMCVYRDAPIVECNTQFTDGPMAYLYTTEQHVADYEGIKKDLSDYIRSDDIVVFSREGLWMYTCIDNEIGSYSTWRTWIDSDRFREYYELRPDKLPTCVYVLYDEVGAFESDIIQANEVALTPNSNTMSGYLYDYICDENFEVIKGNCGTIYRKP